MELDGNDDTTQKMTNSMGWKQGSDAYLVRVTVQEVKDNLVGGAVSEWVLYLVSMNRRMDSHIPLRGDPNLHLGRWDRHR